MTDRATAQASLWRFGDVEFDELRRELRLKGKPVELEAKPLDLLLQLLRHAGEVLTKEELLDAVWPGVITVEGSLTTAVSKLRKAIGDEEQNLIATVPRTGYRLLATVQRKPIVAPELAGLSFKPGELVPGRDQWKLVRRLDLSPSSEVWLAEHAKTREPRVFKFAADGLRLRALKREVTLARVLRETLGERPHFVRIHEWNFDQAPYYLESEFGGLSLLEWSGQQPGGLAALALGERLSLLAEIAEAVAEAHGAGVLHKDLKPANVLVSTRGDGGRQIKVADFGSGRLLTEDGIEALSITRLGFTQSTITDLDPITGTPLYIAPEVLAGSGATAAADVYALGVMLYQLCVADFRKPMAAGWEADIEDELLREDIALAANGNPAKRLGSATELAQRLRGLDARRSERHLAESALQRAQAAEHRLQHARLRRPWIAAAGVALILGLVTSLWFFRQARQGRDEALALNSFLMQDVLRQAIPSVGGQADIPLRSAVEASIPHIAERFAEQPEVAAESYRHLSELFSNLGDFGRAAELLELAAQRYAAVDGERSPRRLEVLLDASIELGNAGQLEAAQQRIDEVARDAPARLHRMLQFSRAQLEMQREDCTAAIALLEGIPDLMRDNPGARMPMAVCYKTLGRYDEADALFEQHREFLSRDSGTDAPDTLYQRSWIAINRFSYRGAAAVRAEAETLLPAMKAAFGVDAENTLWLDAILGIDDLDHARYDAAISHLREAFDGQGRAQRLGQPRYDMGMYLAETLKRAGRTADARALTARLCDEARSLQQDNPRHAELACRPG